MPKSKKSNYSEIDEIREDLHSLKDNVVELTRHLKKDGVEQAGEANMYVKERLADIQSHGKKGIKQVEEQVKNKPGQSLAIAFATGAVLSMLLRGRG